jgi:hypothetical protein
MPARGRRLGAVSNVSMAVCETTENWATGSQGHRHLGGVTCRVMMRGSQGPSSPCC